MTKPLNRNLWVDYLRSALTVLVVAHHASLAYTTFARFDKEAYISSTHPIVDVRRWVGLDIFENFNDIFFMSLMFLVGGLFLVRSSHKKGIYLFIKDRFYRLLIPFITLGTFLMLIAYFPAYYIARENTDLVAYIKDFFLVEQWPVGPPWFIWVLFVFNLLFILLNRVIIKTSKNTGTIISSLQNKPWWLFILWWLITWVLYVPVAYAIGAGTWTGLGPFDFQLSRVLLYFGYFMLGVLIGATDFNQQLFSLTSAITRKWWLWVILALTVYAILTIVERKNILADMVKANQLESFSGWMIYFSIYTASCTLSSIAFLTTFRKLIHTTFAWWDSLASNAYLIYLTHYPFLIWIQFLLMPYHIPAFIKFLLTFIFSLALSWGLSNLLRKIKLINQYF
ncbi:acyltransferase [Emticicia sp. BO119]|uniref:acyltransferase family protein n=1 Tax=Emticicia sp. BO119 TaxID=2757768 RepID=UPI0015F0E8B2|nr:acyltransferase [Emticicia sp. BO119]MBA4853838.1 acyltransferase [Emticicia sp. BO119]